MKLFVFVSSAWVFLFMFCLFVSSSIWYGSLSSLIVCVVVSLLILGMLKFMSTMFGRRDVVRLIVFVLFFVILIMLIWLLE